MLGVRKSKLKTVLQLQLILNFIKKFSSVRSQNLWFDISNTKEAQNILLYCNVNQILFCKQKLFSGNNFLKNKAFNYLLQSLLWTAKTIFQETSLAQFRCDFKHKSKTTDLTWGVNYVVLHYVCDGHIFFKIWHHAIRKMFLLCNENLLLEFNLCHNADK